MDLKELIKQELKRQGLAEGLNVLVNVESENEVAEAVAGIKARMATADGMKELLGEIGLDSTFQDVLQKEGDRRASTAIETYKKKHGNEGGSDGKPGQGANPGNQGGGNESGNQGGSQGDDSRIDKLEKLVGDLTNQLTGQMQAQTQAQMSAKVKNALKEAGLPESWSDRVKPEKEEEIATAIEPLKEEFNTIKQSAIDAALEEQGLPIQAAGSSSTESEIKRFAETITNKSDEMQVDEI